MKKIWISMPDELYQVAVKIKQERHLVSISEVIRSALVEMNRRDNPSYAKAKVKLSMEERAREKAEELKIRGQIKKDDDYERGVKVTELLGGEVVMQNGFPHCKYLVYEQINGRDVASMEMMLPFENLYDGIVEAQYRNYMGETGAKVKKTILEMLAKKKEDDKK